MLFHQHFKLGVVIVPEADALSLAHADAVNKAGMHQLVGQNKRAACTHGGQNALIGVVAAAEHQCGLRAIGRRQFPLKSLLLVAGAREQARRTGAHAQGGSILLRPEFLPQVGIVAK